MMRILYSLGIWMYRTLVLFASSFNTKAKLLHLGVKESTRQIKKGASPIQSPVWFHCASLGEFEMARPVLEKFKTQYPEIPVLLSFFSPSGYEIRKDYAFADHICYLPFDSRKNAAQWVEYYKPRVALFAKYEFWLHYSEALQKNSIPSISFSSLFRKEQIFFKQNGGLFRSILKSFEHFFVQNKNSKSLLHTIGIDQVTIAGDTRFDQVQKNRELANNIEFIDDFAQGHTCWVGGSIWQKDMEVLSHFMKQTDKNTRFLLAPHDISAGQLKQLEALCPLPSRRYSELKKHGLEDIQVVFIDNIGMLSALYQYADFAFIGGGFKEGLHNTLEAITFECPVFFGNLKYRNFQEALDMIQLKIGFAVKDGEALFKKYNTLRSEEVYKKTQEAANHYVKANLGASDTIIEYLSKNILSK